MARLLEHAAKEMVLLERIELSTSPLPRECSTTELQQPKGLAVAPPLAPARGIPQPLDGKLQPCHLHLAWKRTPKPRPSPPRRLGRRSSRPPFGRICASARPRPGRVARPKPRPARVSRKSPILEQVAPWRVFRPWLSGYFPGPGLPGAIAGVRPGPGLGRPE